ncbi:MAG TPA: PAS domain-containing protein [Blastocatellia bacterium]|nr:PAS domain-containing protein [Blastocatellia bacterium]
MRPSYNFLQTLTRAPNQTARYGLAVIVTGLTLFIGWLLEQAFGEIPPVILLIVPVAVSAWHGGLRSGWLATLLGGLGYNYFFLEPRYTWLVITPADWMPLALYLGVCWLVSWLIETTQTARRQAEANLREVGRLNKDLDIERARLKVVIENVPAGLLMADAPCGEIVLANQRFEWMVGYPIISSWDYKFHRDWVAYHPNGQLFQDHEYPMERSLRGEIVQNFEALYERCDGSWKGWVRVSTAPLRDASDKIIGVVGIASDISEEKQAREALRQSQERLKTAQKAAHIGTFEWDIQTGVNIWSEEIEAIYRLSPGSFGGTYEAWVELVHPEDRAQAEEDVQRALEYGEYISEWRVIWPDGSIHWIQGRGKVYYDGAGQPLYLFGINKDVTDRKFIAEKLRASERRLKMALAAVQMGTYHRDWLTNDLDCSAACKANFGRSPDATFTYHDLLETIHPDDRDRVRMVVQQGEQNREEFQDEFRVIWPDGSLHWIYFCGRVTYGSDGQPLYSDGVTLDATERKVLEESLRYKTESLQKADHRKDEFLATLAHELRNPLAPIRNAVQILTKRGDDRAMVAQYCEVLDRQVRHMVRLVDDLLDVSRVGRGKITLQKAPVDLAQVVSAAVETSHPLIEARHHKLTISLPESPLFVEADAARLAQVLSNLLNNAAKYTDDGGRIDLIAERVNAEMRLRVCDNGIGIPPENLPQVFEMFAQVESDTERSQGGLGIGLTLARRLVEMHGGKIEAHSAGLGKGSEFVVRLPARTESLADPNRKPVGNLSTQAANVSRRVLIVDDNKDSAESLAVLLRLDGHEVRLAHDGLTALEEARVFQPDVMFLDINLPGMNGYEVSRRLRLDPELRGITLVAMTGYGQKEDRRRTQEAGFDHHFIKPVDPDMIYELMLSLPGNQSRNELNRALRKSF